MPSDEQFLLKENRQSGVFDNSVLQSSPAVITASPGSSALSNDERKKFDDERIKLFMQLDERVRYFPIYRTACVSLRS